MGWECIILPGKGGKDLEIIIQSTLAVKTEQHHQQKQAWRGHGARLGLLQASRRQSQSQGRRIPVLTLFLLYLLPRKRKRVPAKARLTFCGRSCLQTRPLPVLYLGTPVLVVPTLSPTLPHVCFLKAQGVGTCIASKVPVSEMFSFFFFLLCSSSGSWILYVAQAGLELMTILLNIFKM